MILTSLATRVVRNFSSDRTKALDEFASRHTNTKIESASVSNTPSVSVMDGAVGNNVFTILAGAGTVNIQNFGGRGTGTEFGADVTARAGTYDTVKFVGAGMDADKMFLTEVGADVHVTFLNVANTTVVLEGGHHRRA